MEVVFINYAIVCKIVEIYYMFVCKIGWVGESAGFSKASSCRLQTAGM
jgi:hypothetical protein